MNPQDIRARRTDLGLSEADLAEELGVNQLTVADWENGRSVPAELDVERLIRVLEAGRLEEWEGVSDDALREHKREMFDGMRAMHQSEISHTNHSITMLLAVAGAAGAAVLAMLFPQTPPTHPAELAWGLFVIVLVLNAAIVWPTIRKIGLDHRRHARYGFEYERTRLLLGFRRKKPFERTGKGHHETQWIIGVFATVVTFLALVFALFK